MVHAGFKSKDLFAFCVRYFELIVSLINTDIGWIRMRLQDTSTQCSSNRTLMNAPEQHFSNTVFIPII